MPFDLLGRHLNLVLLLKQNFIRNSISSSCPVPLYLYLYQNYPHNLLQQSGTQSSVLSNGSLAKSVTKLAQCDVLCLAAICSNDLQVLQGHMQLALADAQSITVLRAIQKGNAPTLIASLAHDTANVYQAAAQAFKQVASTNGTSSKAGKYAEWKLLVFQGYMFAFTGEP